jgi:hypothetical protein
MRIRLKSNRPRARLQAPAQALPPQQGFALIEIMIGGCILGFSVVSLYSAYSYGFALIRLSQEYVRADQILVQKLETLRFYNWSQSLLTTAGEYQETVNKSKAMLKTAATAQTFGG